MGQNKQVITMSQVQLPVPEKREKPPVLSTNTIRPKEFSGGERHSWSARDMITMGVLGEKPAVTPIVEPKKNSGPKPKAK
jgi:hypothetical protein